MDRRGFIAPAGEQHHRHQGAQRHGCQPQHQLPEPGREGRRPGGKPATECQIQPPVPGGPQQLVQEPLCTQQFQIGIQHGADRDDEGEKDGGERQPPRPAALAAEQPQNKKHRQGIEHVGVPHPDDPDAGDAQG